MATFWLYFCELGCTMLDWLEREWTICLASVGANSFRSVGISIRSYYVRPGQNVAALGASKAQSQNITIGEFVESGVAAPDYSAPLPSRSTYSFPLSLDVLQSSPPSAHSSSSLLSSSPCWISERNVISGKKQE